MIVVDTSALIAIVLGEPGGAPCMECLSQKREIVISAATLTEALIVAARRERKAQLEQLIKSAGIVVVPVTEAFARRVADAYDLWGKGVHPARLNLGDCFAYALAMERGCPLLFVGDDFSLTDVRSALSSSEG